MLHTIIFYFCPMPKASTVGNAAEEVKAVVRPTPQRSGPMAYLPFLPHNYSSTATLSPLSLLYTTLSIFKRP